MTEDSCRYGSAEPDLDKCRTASVGATIPGTTVAMYYCLLDNADCRYARSFGFDYVCKHADNHLFALPRQTKREQVDTRSRYQADGKTTDSAPAGHSAMSAGSG